MEVNSILSHATSNTTENQFLFFDIASGEYGVEITFVKEIIKVCSITKVPHTPSYVKGIINLRGDIIPVVSVRERFDIENIPYDERTCIIVLDFEGDSVGLIVDCVNEVLYIDTENITPPPSEKHGYSNKHIKSIGRTEDSIKQIIDLSKILSE